MDIFESINNFATNYNKNKEIVSDEDAIFAQFILSHLEIKTKYDVLLFCLCSNLMNSYVKQEKALFGYYFKKSIFILIHDSNKYNIDELKLCYSKDNGNTLLTVSICNVLFSFHSVDKTIKNMINDKYKEDIVFDNIYKQTCSVSIFNLFRSFVFNNSLYLLDLFNKALEFVNLYKENKITLEFVKKYTSLPSYCFE